LATNSFDAIVIGAGPAGALSACLLARGGARVLLVERKAFPRPKVCGGCVNATAIAVLDRGGLGDRVRALGARPIDTVRVHQRARVATLPIPQGLAVSRSALDAELAAAAIDAGVTFVQETTARVVPEGESPAHDGWRRVVLQARHGAPADANARVILVADGLSHSSLRECSSMRSRPARGARVGVGGFAPTGCVQTSPGSITMAVGRGGYVGAVEVEDGRVNVAAALDPAFLKARASMSHAVADILAESGLQAGPALAGVDWSGTIPLTRRMPHPAARRLFVLGDAAGYVEPFTGEGMAWAFTAAEAVAPLASRAIAAWQEELEHTWVAEYARRIGREQRWCRAVARVLRRPALTMMTVALLQRRPGLARPVLAHFAPRAPQP
jgi:flavin-dependent dehydrogenase